MLFEGDQKLIEDAKERLDANWLASSAFASIFKSC